MSFIYHVIRDKGNTSQIIRQSRSHVCEIQSRPRTAKKGQFSGAVGIKGAF